MKWNRLLALCLCLLLLPTPVLAAETPLWSQAQGEHYVTFRLEWPDWKESAWSDLNRLTVRYADTGQPVTLTSDHRQGWLFATVPAADKDRPLEVVPGTPLQFSDCADIYKPIWADHLNLRGILLGDEQAALRAEQPLTRAEAAAALSRFLSLQPAGDPGYADVTADAWYYQAVSAAKAAGILSENTQFAPQDPVTRAQFVTMLYRAACYIGWAAQPAAEAPLDLPDAGQVPSWAKSAYIALQQIGVSVGAKYDNPDATPMEGSQYLYRADPHQALTRGDGLEMVYELLRYGPVYPTQTAIEWGFDAAMPVIDGSTSTKPYTDAVYGSLFTNYQNHPTWPEKHSKSYYSYERVISGEADVLFASTKPTRDTLEKAAAAGVELEFIPIAYDAQVFFTHPDNSIEGLTMEQIADIYLNNPYTNWSQLGGPDALFVPYCRNADSGSQAQMEEFFLKGQDIHPDIRRETTSVSMASVLTDVYDAYRAEPLTFGLGYSIYYYAQQASMMLLPQPLKYLKIDGVYPTDETIADGSYPLAGYNYAVIRADSPEDSLARRMVAFMTGQQGQQCVVNAGFGPLIENY